MKINSTLNPVVLFAAIFAINEVSPSATANPTSAQQAQIDQLKTAYPLDTCPVSGDKLSGGSMGGKPVDYLYTRTKADGTPSTRLVRFCCKDCPAKFKRNPDKYLKTLDAAQANRDSTKPAASGT